MLLSTTLDIRQEHVTFAPFSWKQRQISRARSNQPAWRNKISAQHCTAPAGVAPETEKVRAGRGEWGKQSIIGSIIGHSTAVHVPGPALPARRATRRAARAASRRAGPAASIPHRTARGRTRARRRGRGGRGAASGFSGRWVPVPARPATTPVPSLCPRRERRAKPQQMPNAGGKQRRRHATLARCRRDGHPVGGDRDNTRACSPDTPRPESQRERTLC